jgi:hypothetical protein
MNNTYNKIFDNKYIFEKTIYDPELDIKEFVKKYIDYITIDNLLDKSNLEKISLEYSISLLITQSSKNINCKNILTEIIQNYEDIFKIYMYDIILNDSELDMLSEILSLLNLEIDLFTSIEKFQEKKNRENLESSYLIKFVLNKNISCEYKIKIIKNLIENNDLIFDLFFYSCINNYINYYENCGNYFYKISKDEIQNFLEFLNFIVNMCNVSIDKMIEPKNVNNILDFDISNITNYWQKIYISTFKSINVLLFPAFESRLNKKSNFLFDFNNYNNNKEDIILTNNKKLIDNLNILYINSLQLIDSIFSEDIYTDFIAFLNYITLNSQVFNTKTNEIYDKNNIHSLYDMLMSIIFGLNSKLRNPHIRFSAVTLLGHIWKESIYFNYNIFSPKNVQFALLKYITDVKFFDWTSPDKAIFHIDTINSILITVHKKLGDDFFVIHDDLIIKPFITPELVIKLMDNANYIFQIIEDIGNLDTLTLTQIRESIAKIYFTFSNIIDIILILMTGIKVQELFLNKDNKFITTDLLIGINMFLMKFFLIFSSGKHVIYTKAHIASEVSFTIGKFMDILYYLIENKSILLDNLDKNAILYLINATKLNIPLEHINTIKEFFSTSPDINNNIDNLPDQLVDQIFMIPISDPVILPNTEGFYDKNNMMYYLRLTPINPMTREPLKPEDLENYNNLDHIKEKLKEFWIIKNNYKLEKID